MALTREQSNKIKVDENTEVACIYGEKIYADNLQKWAYRRLETWPDLFEALKDLQKAVREHNLLDIKKRFSLCNADAQANKVIAEAEKTVND